MNGTPVGTLTASTGYTGEVSGNLNLVNYVDGYTN